MTCLMACSSIRLRGAYEADQSFPGDQRPEFNINIFTYYITSLESAHSMSLHCNYRVLSCF
jgi:hypothetical protein